MAPLDPKTVRHRQTQDPVVPQGPKALKHRRIQGPWCPAARGPQDTVGTRNRGISRPVGLEDTAGSEPRKAPGAHQRPESLRCWRLATRRLRRTGSGEPEGSAGAGSRPLETEIPLNPDPRVRRTEAYRTHRVGRKSALPRTGKNWRDSRHALNRNFEADEYFLCIDSDESHNAPTATPQSYPQSCMKTVRLN